MLIARYFSTRLVKPLAARYMSAASTPLLLSPSDASALKGSTNDVAFLDATWFMPNSPRKGKDEFVARRIPGARFLDLDEVASPHGLGLKHMIPDSTLFAQACEKLGVSNDTHVVLYDGHGVFSSPRALYMFRNFGHAKSSVLDGGIPRWLDEGLPTETGDIMPPPKGSYAESQFQGKAVKNYEDIVANSAFNTATNANAELVLDARSAGRFTGKDPEPRPGLSSGHIPNSFSLPFNLFLHRQKGKNGEEYTIFRPVSEIKDEIKKSVGPAELGKILSGERSVITSCGSGMTAGVLWLGLQLLGVKNVALYDESWTGYAMRPGSRIEKD